MAPSRAPSTQLLRSLRSLELSSRSFSTTPCTAQDQVQVEQPRASFYKNPNPETVFVPRLERKLAKAGTPPIGSRRRRMALHQSQGIPFDQLPFQCFQEARSFLIQDRVEKLQQIDTMRTRIEKLQAADGDKIHRGGEAYKQRRIESMRQELERLKILADINDPNVKRRFEDGQGDMNKPIYRHLAHRKWHEYKRKILVQRLTQLKTVPDVVPHCDPELDVSMTFGSLKAQPGDFVHSSKTEAPGNLHIQSFDREKKLVSILLVDSDVPNLETDSFDSRCHFLACNVPLNPTAPLFKLAELSPESQVVVPWLPPSAQKGSPYHRLSYIIFQQKDNVPVDLEIARKNIASAQGFSARRFMSQHLLQPIGATLFRTKWDDGTAEVMQRAGIEGADVELKRRRVEPLPYERRNPATFR